MADANAKSPAADGGCTGPVAVPSPSRFDRDLVRYLQVSQQRFKGCIAEMVHTVSLDEPKATVHFQYVRFDPISGEPRFDVLAKTLAKHVVKYSLCVRTRERMRAALDDEDDGDLFVQARDYFRKIADSGEVGELLLFFLLEAAFGAPQVVCKMELKTNPGDEVKGADGIHVLWDAADGHLDVFLGESKLYQSISGALDSVFTSLTEFYDLGRLDEELHLVTSHFKFVDAELQDTITTLLDRGLSESSCHIVHACLIGWDWKKYAQLEGAGRDAFVKEFEDRYKKYAANIAALLNKRFSSCIHKQISFKFLFLPFKDVGEFRRAFYKELCGVDIDAAGA